jgi:hypothetical protein
MSVTSADQSGVGGLEPLDGRAGATASYPASVRWGMRSDQQRGVCHAPWRRTKTGLAIVIWNVMEMNLEMRESLK